MEQPRHDIFAERVQRIIPDEKFRTKLDEDFNVTEETFHFLSDILKSRGFEKYDNVTSAMSEIGDQNLIVRRENPQNIITLLSDGEYEVGFEDTRYSNCVEWNPSSDGSRGITNAYLEGMTHLNNVVTLVGFAHRPEHDLQKLPDATINFHGLEREKVRSYKGKVELDDVTMINLRVPAHFLPESELTEFELEKLDEYLGAKAEGKVIDPVMVHRSFIKPIVETSIH